MNRKETLKFTVDTSLLKKYDRPGPRYTSYPTAPKFNESFGAKEFIREVEDNNRRNDTPLSLYFHIPFCDTLCYFCGCNMQISHNREYIDEYVELMKREILSLKGYISPSRKVAQLHWGGGTPSYLEPDQMKNLFETIRGSFDFADDAEIGIEFDPRGLTEGHISTLHELGFNRGSLGVQDFNPEVQKAINRIQTIEETKWTVETLKKYGFESINLDLIYGLPFQTAKSFEKTVDLVLGMEPARFAVFNFAFVPWLKKHQKVIKPATLPAPEVKLEILKMTIEKLADSGYEYIGMDHFARPDDELAVAQREKTLYRNFQGYSTKAGCDLYAFGITSISMLPRAYAQNVKTIDEYRLRIENGTPAVYRGYRLSKDDLLRRHVIMRLMCDFELEKRDVERKFNITFDEYFSGALEQLLLFQDDGLLSLSGDGITILPMGRLVIRNIAMCFDAYLPSEADNRQIYSRTV